MKTGNNKWLIVLLATLLACCLVTGTLFACQKEDDNNKPTPPDPTPVVEGTEKGVYSLEEMTLTLNGLGNFTLSQDGNLSSGTYEEQNGAFTLTFSKTEEGTATCTLQDNILVLTIGSSEYRLYKQVKLTVTFDDGTSTSDVSVTNGQLVAKPTDPAKEGYRFIAWYKAADFSGKPFDFETETITANITLYAKWVEYTEGTTEYTVSFNLGYDTAETIASQRTLSGKLLDGAPAPTREGYTFKGWWISAYDQADKLTYQYAEGSSFTSDTTLFALWQADGTTLGTMDVTSTGVSWAGVTESAKLTITKPDGTTLEQSFGATGASAYAYDLSAQAAGEYKFTLTYGNNTVERYFLNKGLNRVSGFKVVGNSILLFDGVDNAEGYYITVKCGDSDHNHTDVYIGKSTTYNFVNCPMASGGIVFTVKAVAAGYYASVATFTYDRSLAAVTGITYDATTGLLTWAAVENAQHYIVTVAGQEYYLGTETKLDIKSLPAGTINVTVKAVTEGFNSALATSATITKTDYAAPTQLAVKQGVLTWSAVEGATYRVQINDVVVDVTEAQLTLDAKYITLGKEYAIKVKAVFADGESLWSDTFTLSSAKADAGLKGLAYANGKLSWTAMSDADVYEYQINAGVAATTANSYAYVQLTKEGTNQLKVRYRTLTGDYSEWATLEVYAYSLTLDSMGGTGVETQYKAIGDTVELPTTERVGYDFAGWYNVAGGSASNGTKFTAKTFDNPVNIVLYANWLPRSYEITLDYNEYGEGTVEKVSVTYTKHYTLPVPKMLTDDASAQMGFVGWYATPDGKGVQYTDELGNSLSPWNITDNTTLYAKYVEAFAFSPDGEGGYSVKAGKNLGYYTESITIPATYKGLPVRSIAEYGFKGYSYLKYVTLPDTLESIPTTAFEGCSRIQAFSMTTTEKPANVFMEVNGTIVMTMYGQTTLHLIPSALTGTFRVPEGVNTIGSRTFNKAKFDTVVIPASVTNIEADAFVNCSNLKSVIFDETPLTDESGNELPKQLLTIDNAAFNDTLYVEKFVLPARLGEIKNVQQFFSQFKLLSGIEFTGEFEDQVYSALTTYDGGKNIAGMLANANKDEIIYCPISLSDAAEFEVEIPSSVIKIAAHAFDSFEESKNPALKKYNPVTKITFNGNLVSIGEYAFTKARNLTEVTFKAVADPVGMTIGDYAFYRCNKLNVVTFEEDGAWSTTDSNIFEATKSCGVKSIGAHAFDSASITELKLPYSLKTLGEYAFANTTALKSIDLANVSPILTFGDYAFSMCRSLTTVELTKNVGTMNFNLVFYECTKLELTVSPDNPNYTVGDGGVLYNKDVTEIIYYPDSFEGVYELPESVTKISGAVFKGKNSMTSIVISKNIVEIGDSAFEDCANLKSVTFAADGTDALTIGAKAFYNCGSLKQIELPARTKSVGEQCFSYDGFADSSTRALEKITLNEGLESIGAKAFAYTIQLTSINIPSTVTSIGDSAFYYSAIGSITFTARNGKELVFGESLFYGCSNLTNVVLPEGLVNIPARTFYSNSSLKSVTIPTTVRNDNAERAIGQFAFYNCAKLSEVIFTKGGSEALSFAGGAFYGCDALTKLSLPARIASMDTSKYDVFELGTNGSTDDGDFKMVNCNVYAWNNSYTSGSKDISNVAEIEVEEGGAEFSSYKGVLYNADKSVLVWCPFGKVGEVEVAKEATTFRASAFNNCHYITSVVFEKGGTADFAMADNATTGTFGGSTAFFGCYNLKTITFPARLKSLGNYALYNDTGIREIAPDGSQFYSTGTAITKVLFEDGCKLESIGNNAFEKLAIDELVLPNGVMTVGANVLKSSPITKITLSEQIDATSLTNITTSAEGLTSITVPEKCTTLKSDYDGQIIYSYDMTKMLYVVKGFQTDLYTVPATITQIAANAFKDREGIKNIVFAPAEDGATLEIGNYAFSGTGIESIVLPARVTKLGTYVFRDCKSLTSVTFEEGYKYAAIPDWTFAGCSALESITIPGEVSSIGTSAFQGAGKNEDGVVSGLKSITFALTADGQQSVLSEIKNNVFNDCYALSTIRYALKKNEDGSIQYAEGNTLPSAITKLGQYSSTSFSGPFKNCISLKQITLPDGLTVLAKDLFSGCVNLTNVKLPSSMTTIRENAFANSGITGLDLSAYADNSLTIYEGAFDGCANLASFDTSKVKLLCLNNTFRNCTSLTSMEIGNKVQLKAKYSSTSYIYNKAFTGSGLKTLTIDQNVLQSMFEGCESIENVILGANVTQIGDSAFEKATGLVSVDVSAVSTLALKADAFREAASLKTIDLSKVIEIGKYAFQNCASLTNIGTLNEKITSLLDYTFDGTGLTSFDFSATNVTTLGNYVFRNSKLTSVVVPETITSIGTSVFAGCANLSKAQFLAPVAKMGSNMFSGCTSLTSVTIGDSVTELGDSVFANTALAAIDLNNVATLGQKVFENCASLKTVTINAENITWSSYGNTFMGVSGVQFVVPEGGKLSADGGILYAQVDVKDAQGIVTGTVNKLLLNLDTRKDVVVKDGTQEIARNAFRYNTYVETVTLPESVTTIDGYYTFAACTNLKSINLDKVTSFGSSTENPFQNTAITEVKISTTVNKLFRYAANLQKVTIVTDDEITIASEAFKGCTSLSEIAIEGDGKIVGLSDSAFSQTAFTSLDAFQDVKTIGRYAFEDSKLVTAVIPEGVTTLGNNCFQDCYNLVSVTVPASLTNFGSSPFIRSNKIVEVINLGTLPITAGSTEYGSVAQNALNVTSSEESGVDKVGDYMFYSDGVDNYLVGYVGSDTQLTLPANYYGASYKICDYAFYENETITSVVGNANVTGIGDYAFYGCTALASVNGFTAIKYIGDYAFYDCPISNITLPNTLEEIGNYAFKNCDDLVLTESNNLYYLGNSDNLYMMLLKPVDNKAESYAINSATKYIASEAFYGCSAMTSITIPEGVVSIGAKAFYNCSGLTEVTIPASVKTIGDEAFRGCAALTSVTLNEGLANLGTGVFYGCSKLAGIVLPESATNLGTQLFYNCTALTEVTFGSALTEIPAYTFYSCTSLAQITIPASVKSIGGNAFYGCKALTSVVIPEGVTEVSERTFYNCTALTTVSLPNSITYIGDYAFSGCTALTSVGSLDNVTEIAARAFQNCSALTSVGSIANVESIGTYAFAGCTSLQSLTITGKTTFIDAYAFQKWTASQTITFTEFTAAPSTWKSTWKSSCSAKLVWATAEA